MAECPTANVSHYAVALPERPQSIPYLDIRGQPLEQKQVDIVHRRVFISPTSLSIKFDGPWGDNSYYLHPNCGLYKLKKGFTTVLKEMGMIADKDMDRGNSTPHINLKAGGGKSTMEEIKEILGEMG